MTFERQFVQPYSFANHPLEDLLGQPVDENAAAAKYNDGILELTLPKKAAASAKRITIQ